MAGQMTSGGAHPHGYFGVFDGHGGDGASEHCRQYMHRNVVGSDHFPDIVSALQDGFLRTDADVLRAATAAKCHGRKGWDAGSAAVVMFVDSDRLTLAHAGDCRALLVKRAGSPEPFVELTSDHAADFETGADGAPRPVRPDECERVRGAGGSIDPGGYVHVGEHSRELPMTRALGDLPLKVRPGADWQHVPALQQVVTARPDIRVLDRSDDDLCVVLASDGLFGSVMSNREVASLVRSQLEAHESEPDAVDRTARALTESALKEHQGGDNVSVVVVALEPPAVPSLHASLHVPAHAPARTSPTGRGLCQRAVLAAHEPSALRVSERASSQESLSTVDATSPGRLPMSTKLRMRFCDAYPPAAGGKENAGWGS